MNIRPGSVSDAHALSSLISSFQSELVDHPSGLGAEQYLASVSEEAERGYLESDRYMYLIAETEGSVLGFIALRDRSHLFHLFVKRERHRIGIARKLWDSARIIALAGGTLSRFTVNSSLIAIKVYESFGFVSAGEVVKTHGISFLPMALELSPRVETLR